MNSQFLFGILVGMAAMVLIDWFSKPRKPTNKYDADYWWNNGQPPTLT